MRRKWKRSLEQKEQAQTTNRERNEGKEKRTGNGR
jgi:hypothetical protein